MENVIILLGFFMTIAGFTLAAFLVAYLLESKQAESAPAYILKWDNTLNRWN